jgi:RNA polymerase sigma-70 factor, ECF subfamily
MLLAMPLAQDALGDSLVARLKQGKQDALADAFDAHHGRVRAFARKLVGNEAYAEDLVQEVFVALPKAVQSFQERSSLLTFLLAMTCNLGHKHVRTASRKRAMITRFEKEPREELADGERESDRAELGRQLANALDTLPLDQREAFILMELEEYTSTEVAEIVGAPEGTVRTRLFHAKRKLREQLEAWGPQ